MTAPKPPDGTYLFGLGHVVLNIEDPDTLEYNRRKYVCAICYADLQLYSLAEGAITALMCSDPECSGTGFVTRTWAQQARTQNRMDYHNARHDMRSTPFGHQVEAEGHQPVRLTEDEIRKLLGF